MFVLLNGSFGIGKTTVAGLLAAAMPGVRVYDPEHIGSVLHRLPPWMLGRAKQPDDFQDLRLWRRLIGPLARLEHGRAQAVVIPMSFTNLSYLNGFAAELAKTAPVHRLCLVAPHDVIEARLTRRGAKPGTVGGDWVFRRARECADAHRDPVFGQPVDATPPPHDVAAAIVDLVGLR